MVGDEASGEGPAICGLLQQDVEMIPALLQSKTGDNGLSRFWLIGYCGALLVRAEQEVVVQIDLVYFCWQ